jgi:hypothetical protein
MNNYDFIERRIRFLRWIFSKEEPWRKFAKLGATLTEKFNNELKETLMNTTFGFSSAYSGTGNSVSLNYPYSSDTWTVIQQILKTTNASAVTNNSITYNNASSSY